jgi:zinc D-Ala-D-Ala carboxypeptidase
MRLTDHFTLAEATRSAAAEQRGIANTPSPAEMDDIIWTAENMEAVRSLFGRPVQVTSWFRNAAVNAAVRGSPTSDHLTGRAVDFRIPPYTAMETATRIAASPLMFDQLILYSNRVHLGFRRLDGPQPVRRELKTRISGGYALGLLPELAIA